MSPGSGFGSLFSCQGNTELGDTEQYQRSTQELDDARRLLDSYTFKMHTSDPTSPFSSSKLTASRTSGDMYLSPNMFPQNVQVWSAPEMPVLDMNLGEGYSHRIHADLTVYSVDNSPLQSPILSPRKQSSNGPPSPLLTRLSLDTLSVHRDNNCQANNIHPLPLPPGATSPSQTTSVPHISARAEIMPPKPQWQKGKLLGRGTFGSVYVASNRETGALCAMKEVELAFDDPKAAECVKQLEQEIKVLSRLKHPNIVQYYGSEVIGDRFYIYLEYVHPGSISKYVYEHGEAMTESVVRNFTRHILSGLAYLHSKKTIHRDIKGANLLVDAHGVVKLADFGMAKHLTGPVSNLSLKGSPYWMAPELLQFVMKKDANPDLALAVDIWSLGCTIIEMLDGKPPWSEYEGAAAMFKVMRETPPIPETLSRDGKDFLRCCFRRNPAERPTASMLLEHRFLKTPQALDISACTQAINGMTMMDISGSGRQPFGHKLEHLPVSPNQVAGVHLANNSTHPTFSPPKPSNIHDHFPQARPMSDITMRLST